MTAVMHKKICVLPISAGENVGTGEWVAGASIPPTAMMQPFHWVATLGKFLNSEQKYLVYLCWGTKRSLLD